MSASNHSALRDSYEDLFGRARARVRADDAEGAIALYRRLVTKLERLSDAILARRPELRDMHHQARAELTGLLRSLGRYAEAIEAVEPLLNSHSEEADLWRSEMAIMRIAKGEIEQGLLELRTLAEEEPETAEKWLVLANECRIEGRFSESQAALERVLATAKEDNTALARAHYLRFLLLKEMGQPDKAIDAWEQAVRLDTQAARTIRQVYTMLTDMGRYQEASRYVDRDENAMQAGNQRGILASLTGDRARAKQEWQRVAEMDAAEFKYGHDAWVESVLRLADPDPALEWLQQHLHKLGSPRLLILSGIGWAMRRDGELAAKLFQQAIDLLQRARPPKRKLDGADWRLLDSLVADDELKAGLKHYFAVVETLWG